MISIDELKKTRKSFNEKVEHMNNEKDIISIYERYFNWLQDVEDETLYNNEFYSLISSLIKTIHKYGINCKECSTGWNAKLVAKVGDWCSKMYKKKRESVYINNDDKLLLAFGHIWKELNKEKDFATKAYCYQMIDNYEIVDFKNASALIVEPTIVD